MFHFLGRWLIQTIHWIDFVIISLVAWLWAFLPESTHGPMYFRVFRSWCQMFVRALGVRLELHQNNSRRLPAHYVLIANHPSALEDIGTPSLFPVQSLAKAAVGNWFIAGKINRAVGTLFVDRKSADSRHAAKQAIIDTLKSGQNMVIYPEGGCKGRRIAERFYPGAFDAAIQTGLPVLPVFIHYECQDDFEWQPPYNLVDMLFRFMRSQNPTANFHVFDPWYPENFDDAEAFAETARQQYLIWEKQYLGLNPPR